MFAVIKTGGKQYKVEVGTVLKVEKLAADVDSDIEINEVLLVGEGENVTVGTPVVEGAKVVATVKSHGKGDKKINFKKLTLNITKKLTTEKKDTDNLLQQLKLNRLMLNCSFLYNCRL